MRRHRSILPAEAPSRALRNALGRFATGVTVITTRTEAGKLEGVTANSFSAVALHPALVLWNLSTAAPSLPSFLGARYFAINVLRAEQRALSQHFARPAADKYDGITFRPGLGGCPVLEDPLAVFECEQFRTMACGDHFVIVGEVREARYADGEPLIFSSGRYCTPLPLPDAAAPELDELWAGLG